MRFAQPGSEQQPCHDMSCHAESHPAELARIGTPAGQLRYAREWSSPMCGFPVSGQPPAVIFCVHGATRAADRTLQQRLGM